ncbi:recombinase family protein [Nonomuraea jabiensis]|uniref:DNA invertase Pin-like site-specific DNA recombinase n=1 Tax=Nonomuraea jabiensis TaxID=882448 RepID=A0A7W9GE24_9ACTN|nr:DNA invertase Pin-like site-specific DNA recombinase [Nonomuraea jabiensis]
MDRTLLLPVMGAFAEFERPLILGRQREGVAAATRCLQRQPTLELA